MQQAAQKVKNTGTQRVMHTLFSNSISRLIPANAKVLPSLPCFPDISSERHNFILPPCAAHAGVSPGHYALMQIPPPLPGNPPAPAPASAAGMQQKHPNYTSNTYGPKRLKVSYTQLWQCPSPQGKPPWKICKTRQCLFLDQDTEPPQMPKLLGQAL